MECSGLAYTGAPRASASSATAPTAPDALTSSPTTMASFPTAGSVSRSASSSRLAATDRRSIREAAGTGASPSSSSGRIAHADEHRARRRRGGVVEGPAQDRAELVEVAHLVRPLRHRRGEPDEIAGEQRDRPRGGARPAGRRSRRAACRWPGRWSGCRWRCPARPTCGGSGTPAGRWPGRSRRPCPPRSPPGARGRSAGRRRSARASISGSSVEPGLPKMWRTPSVRSTSSRASRPVRGIAGARYRPGFDGPSVRARAALRRARRATRSAPAARRPCGARRCGRGPPRPPAPVAAAPG